MNGYHNLASSPPVASDGLPAPVPGTAGTAEEGKWEGVAVGAATLVRNFSSASQRFGPVERSKSSSGHRGGLQAAVRRAFSMRRQPASSFAEGYWRIHDGMDDGDGDGDDDDDAAERQEPARVPEEDEQKKKGAEQQVAGDAAAGMKEIKGKKKRGHILKACKKLLGF